MDRLLDDLVRFIRLIRALPNSTKPPDSKRASF